MFYVKYTGQSFRQFLDKAPTLHSAKLLASKRVEYGMSATVLDENKDPVCHKDFWSNLDRFGWEKWRNAC